MKTYGRAQFRRLLAGFQTSRSGADLAREIGVSRERVRQWKHTFGEIVTCYNPYPEAARLLDDR